MPVRCKVALLGMVGVLPFLPQVLAQASAQALAQASAEEASTPPRAVYVLPMPGGLDQYIALRLTQDHVMQVVTDPTKANLFMTDRVGEDFEQTVREVTLASHPEGETEAASDDADSGKQGEAKTVETFAKPSMRPLSRSRGTVFLVDRVNHVVVWSTLETPKSTRPDDLAKAASRIVDRLAKSEKQN